MPRAMLGVLPRQPGARHGISARLLRLRLTLIGVGSMIEPGAALEMRKMREECERTAEFRPARQPWDLNATFVPMLTGEAHAELAPKVLSTDPWVVLFENFMSDDEVAKYRQHVNGLRFRESTALVGGKYTASKTRTSKTAECNPPCSDAEIYQRIEKRASAIVGVPQGNFESTQATFYEAGKFFHRHHDNSEEYRKLPSGPRIYTFFVYLNEVEEGGATRFVDLNLEVPPKAGSAVLFVNTQDGEPESSESRMFHEGVPVVRGEKLALNMWVRQYNFMEFWRRRCNRWEELFDESAGGSQKVIFVNKRASLVRVFWIDDDASSEVPINSVLPGGRLEINSFIGHRFRFRDAGDTGDTNVLVGTEEVVKWADKVYQIRIEAEIASVRADL